METIKVLLLIIVIVFIVIPLAVVFISVIYTAIKFISDNYKDGASIVDFDIFLADYIKHSDRYKLGSDFVVYSISYDPMKIITIRFRVKDYFRFRKFSKLIESEQDRNIDKYYLRHMNESKYKDI